MWMKFRRRKTNIANQSAKVKGGITISNETNSIESVVLERILNKLESIENKVDNNSIQIVKLNDDMKTYKKAFRIYVENNGVKPDIKKAISEMLED